MTELLSHDFVGVAATLVVAVCVAVAHAVLGGRRVLSLLVLAAFAAWSEGGLSGASMTFPVLGFVCLVSLALVFALARPLRDRHPMPALVVVVFIGGALGAVLASLVAGLGADAPQTRWVVPAMIGFAAAQLATIVVVGLAVFKPRALAAETGVSAPDRLLVGRMRSY